VHPKANPIKTRTTHQIRFNNDFITIVNLVTAKINNIIYHEYK
jgi:hypothetical protein